MKNTFQYLIVVAGISIIFIVIYAALQQNYRATANDPQLQIVHEMYLRLQSGKSIDRYFYDTIDIGQSLTPFVELFDANGEPIRSSGFLNNKMPSLPKGVFDFAKANDKNIFTWQPEPTIRQAIVLKYCNTSPVKFIASGISLSEAETRIKNLSIVVILGWLMSAGLVLLFAVLNFYKRKENL